MDAGVGAHLSRDPLRVAPRGAAPMARPGNLLPSGSRPSLSVNDWLRVGQALGLSPRELEVVQHVFQSKKMIAIALDMHLSIGTVKTYVQRVHQKLQVSDQRDLALAVFAAYLNSTGS